MTQSIRTIKPSLQELFDTVQSPVNGFKAQNHNSNIWFWISDNENIIGDLDAHYEVLKLNNDTIRVDIHFEDDNLGKARFYQYIKALPQTLNWIKWQNSFSIRYNKSFSFDDTDLPQKIHDTLVDFDKEIGDTIRFIKTNTISKDKIDKFIISFEKFKTTDDYIERKRQYKIVPVFREIISETLKNESLTNEHLTGFIQMFKSGVSDGTFDKYFDKNLPDSNARKDLYNKVYEIGEYGYTGAGLNSIDGLSEEQLAIIKQFLSDAFQIQSLKDAVELCKGFEKQNIPYVKSGVYSPWLYYINPQLFPIKNTSHKAFMNWAGMSENYPDCIYSFNQLKQSVQEEELGTIDYYAHTFNESKIDNETSLPMKNNQLVSSLNTILYGPPGTGKTYSSINKAIEAIHGIDFLQGKTRVEIKEEFAKLIANNQITFCTFHQSMSYEDFIEGIKPILDDEDIEEDKLTYSIVDGIFKQLCITAKFEYYKKWMEHEQKNNATIPATYETLYEDLITEISNVLDTQKDYKLKTKSGVDISIVEITAKQNLTIVHDNADGDKRYIVSKKRLSKLYAAFPSKENLDSVKNIDKEFRAIIGGANSTAYWAVLSKLHNSPAMQSIGNSDIIDDLNKITDYETIKMRIKDYVITNDTIEDLTPKKYVVVIDEINRGNVSQIFGELITLIEEDKREGRSEALSLTLPYSKTRFSVPPNLYIIGTMNTADRSVEALDTALRRRFVFKAMEPQPELLNEKVVGEIALSTLLTAINERIGYLLDNDHKIGHSYFYNINNGDITGLKAVFNNAIIPLLKEYFYNDYEKIQLVLGKGFVTDTQQPPQFAGKQTADLDKTTYSFVNLESISDDDFIKALKITVNAHP